ncbi:hypothetical protein IAR50_002055 [Cryptococcus sp. DSM 104548]
MSASGDAPIVGGITLPMRQASVTVLDQVDEDGEHAPHGHQRRDSLETTKSFYAQKAPYASNGSLYRPPSAASRATGTGTVRARSDSHISATTSRAATPSGNPLSPISPPRPMAPLPTPKGFLSPKKSAAAQRLERAKDGRTATARTHYKDGMNGSEVLSDTMTQTGHGYELSVTSKSPSRHETLSPTFSTTLSPEVAPISLPDISSIPDALTVEIPHAPGPPMGTTFNSQGDWDRSLRHSITTVSSPSRPHAMELSSDNLVHRLDPEKALNQVQSARRYSRGSRATFERIRKRHSAGQGEERRRRKYETIDNPLMTFLCGGRVLVGGDMWYSMGVALFLLFAVSGIWIGTTGAWMWRHGSEYGLAKGGGVAITIIFVYLFCLVTSSFAVTSLRDPGIIPRKLDPDPPKTFIEQWWEAYPRDLTVKEARVTVKYCETCESYRAPRCSHCRLCGNCVDGIDHHCSYLHTCVGKRNYFSFLVLLVTSTISDIYIVVFSAVHFSLICHHDNVPFRQALTDSPGAAVSFLLGILTLVPVVFLFQYHMRLLLFNITTLEQIRANPTNSLFAIPVRPDNPFAQPSTWANVVQASIGRPQFPSWIDPSGWEEKDTREVNPALSVNNGFGGREWV